MGKLRCIAVCLFALAAAACEAAAPKGLKTADGNGLCKYAGELRFAGRYATSLAQEAERRAATAKAVKEIASLTARLAAPLAGKNESVVAAVEAVKHSQAATAEPDLQVQAELAGQAARQLTFASGSLRSFVEVLAAMGDKRASGAEVQLQRRREALIGGAARQGNERQHGNARNVRHGRPQHMARRKGFERNTSEGRGTEPKTRGEFDGNGTQDWGTGNHRCNAARMQTPRHRS
ncbi:hypothetical protein ERJ75_001539500 [Trypanosoma vivax]|nr:hypothetical protein ERJ75_001539500 [Trypanosoma vivax]